MTKIDRPGMLLVYAVCLSAFAAAGCLDTDVRSPSGSGAYAARNVDEAGVVIRNAPEGVVVVTYTSHPMRPGAPADGVRAALLRALGNEPLSAASFYWTERGRALDWIRRQFDERRRRNIRPRLILAGHGLGATEASETAREILFGDRDAEIVLLLTVDAVKTNRIGSAAAVTGTAIARRIPGVDRNFTAYDAAPEPDGKRLRAHINYYQTRSANYHGTAMPYAENHRVDDWTGLLNHGNADDFALTFLITDLRQALRAARSPGQGIAR